MTTLRMFVALLVLLVPVSLAAQTYQIWSIDVARCAIGGQHQEGCLWPATGSTPPSDGTSAPQGEAPPDSEPQPSPEPPPPAPATVAQPVQLEDVLVGVQFVHDGAYIDWYTLRINGAYHTHVGPNVLVAGVAMIPFVDVLPAGTHKAEVFACSDALGCVSSSPLTLTR